MIKLTRNLLIVISLLFLVACTKPHPAVGTWDISIDTPVGIMNMVLHIAEDGTGLLVSVELGEQSITDILLGEDSITFSVDVDAQGQMSTLDFTGTVADDVLSGEFGSDFGILAVTGSRSVESDAS